ncbi:hypothetical protein HPB47_027952, partial [Ixodes persulcatus]
MSRRADSRDPAGRTETGEGGPATCTRGSKARTHQQGSKPSAVAPDAGVVLVENYSWKQTRRGNPLLVVRERDSQAREYSFSGSYTRPNAPMIKYYVCLACRKKKEKRGLRSTELPRMKVLGSGEVYDMRNALHLCKPLTSSQVLGKHYERDQRLSLLNCSALCPKEVYEVVQNNFKKELSLRPAEEREAIQRRLPSYKSVKALYYRKIRPGGVRGLRFSAAMQSEQDTVQTEYSETSHDHRHPQMVPTGEDGVPVRRFFWKHTQNGNPLLVVKEGWASAREYTFSSKYGRPGLAPVRYYVCLGCRREREGKALPGRPLPRIKVLEDGRVFDMVTAPHLCSPLTMAQVAGKHFERDHRLSLPNCSAQRAKEAYEAMRANLSEQLSEHPEEERRDIERFLPSFKSVRSMYYRKMRQSGKRWVPYGELQPLAPRAGLEPAMDTPGEAPVVSTTDEPYELEVSSELVQAAVQDSLHWESDKSDPSSAYPLAPTCMWKVEAQDPFQYRLREDAKDDAELVADDALEVDTSQEARAAGHCDSHEKQKPPNGVSVREFFWKQTLRGNPLLMVKGEDSTVREYIFNSKYGRPGAPLVKYYVCLGCRKEREAKALPGGPLARMKVLEDGRVFDMSNTPHFCTPLSMAQ